MKDQFFLLKSGAGRSDNLVASKDFETKVLESNFDSLLGKSLL